MTEISAILSDTFHRPFELPIGKWKYYQEWNNALFLHWAIPFDILRRHVPAQLHLDNYQGAYYVSLVAFTMQKIRPSYLPAVKFISDFHEINLRTYIDNGSRKGVYFLSIEAEKYLSTYIARILSGLPYEKSIIKRTNTTYNSKNASKDFYLDAEFEVKEIISNKSDLDSWLTERYCLYLDRHDETFRYDIHHQEWKINNIEMKRLSLKYTIGEMDLSKNQPDSMHYSEGVKVLAWHKIKV